MGKRKYKKRAIPWMERVTVKRDRERVKNIEIMMNREKKYD